MTPSKIVRFLIRTMRMTFSMRGNFGRTAGDL